MRLSCGKVVRRMKNVSSCSHLNIFVSLIVRADNLRVDHALPKFGLFLTNLFRIPCLKYVHVNGSACVSGMCSICMNIGFQRQLLYAYSHIR